MARTGPADAEQQQLLFCVCCASSLVWCACCLMVPPATPRERPQALAGMRMMMLSRRIRTSSDRNCRPLFTPPSSSCPCAPPPLAAARRRRAAFLRAACAAVAEAVRLLPAPLAPAVPELLVDYLMEVFDEGDAQALVPAG